MNEIVPGNAQGVVRKTRGGYLGILKERLVVRAKLPRMRRYYEEGRKVFMNPFLIGRIVEEGQSRGLRTFQTLLGVSRRSREGVLRSTEYTDRNAWVFSAKEWGGLGEYTLGAPKGTLGVPLLPDITIDVWWGPRVTGSKELSIVDKLDPYGSVKVKVFLEDHKLLLKGEEWEFAENFWRYFEQNRKKIRSIGLAVRYEELEGVFEFEKRLNSDKIKNRVLVELDLMVFDDVDLGHFYEREWGNVLLRKMVLRKVLACSTRPTEEVNILLQKGERRGLREFVWENQIKKQEMLVVPRKLRDLTLDWTCGGVQFECGSLLRIFRTGHIMEPVVLAIPRSVKVFRGMTLCAGVTFECGARCEELVVSLGKGVDAFVVPRSVRDFKLEGAAHEYTLRFEEGSVCERVEINDRHSYCRRGVLPKSVKYLKTDVLELDGVSFESGCVLEAWEVARSHEDEVEVELDVRVKRMSVRGINCSIKFIKGGKCERLVVMPWVVFPPKIVRVPEGVGVVECDDISAIQFFNKKNIRRLVINETERREGYLCVEGTRVYEGEALDKLLCGEKEEVEKEFYD